MARLRSDSGFALLEAVVSAAVLAMIALAIFAGIDGASASSGREKARNIAASLAEADQDRLRMIPVADLATVATTAPYVVADPTGTVKTVDGVKYTVVSKAQFVADDSGGSASCTTDTKSTQYFHISSTVTSAVVGTRIPAVTIDSILAPNVAYSSTKGTLVVQVVDAGGNPVANKLVRITGGITSPGNKLTNSLGCAVFEQVDTVTGGTTYKASLSDPAYVDHFGRTDSTVDAPVLPDKVNRVTMYYDKYKSTTANVVTYAPGSTTTAPGADVPSAAYQVSATNSGETGMVRTWPVTVGAEVGSVATDYEFPFTTPYTYFTGNCHYNDPTTSAYHNTGTTIAGLLAAQQQLAGVAVTVHQPPLNVWMKTDPSGAVPNAQMTVEVRPYKPSGDSCAQKTMTFATFDTDSTSAYKWMVGRSYVNSTLDAGVPYGQYTLCFREKVSGTNYYWAPASYPNAAGSAAYYDNTTPPTGQSTTESFAPAKYIIGGSGWQKGTTCP
jgi:Tfp pilus assembly protein PilV